MLKKYIFTYLRNRPLFFSLIRPQEAELFEKNAQKVQSPMLDLGCGDGFFGELVFGRGKIDVGLDLDNARTRKIENAGIYKQIKFFDGIRIPFKEASFQTVISNCVLEHVEELPKLLNEVYRVLKPKGFFLTTVMTEKWEEYLLGNRMLGNKYALWMRKKQMHVNVFSANKWREEFARAGFKIDDEVAYLSEKTAGWMDFFHYVSLPELITYRLFAKWVMFPRVFSFLRIDRLIEKLIVYPTNVEKSAAQFFVLRKYE